MAKEVPEWMDAKRRKVCMPCGSLYIFISYDNRNYPRELFLMGSKWGTCRASLEGIARQTSSQLWESKLDQVIEDLEGIKCPACERKKGGLEDKTTYPSSCSDCVARTIKMFREMMKESKK